MVSWFDQKKRALPAFFVFPLVVIIAATIAVFMLLAPLFDVFPHLAWFDQQRILQITILAMVSLWICVSRARFDVLIPQWLSVGLSCLVLVLLLSVFFADSRYWACVEFSLWVGLAALFLFAANYFAGSGARSVWLLYLCVFVVAGLTVQFYSSLISGFVFRSPLHARALMDGFENSRWFGQFQTLSLPLMAGMLLGVKRNGAKGALFLVLVLWWVTVWFGQTRGSWLAVGATMMIALFWGNVGRRTVAVLVFSGALGWLLYWWVFLVLAPEYGISAQFREELIGDSGRLDMWLLSLDFIYQHPWLGRGGMAFAGSDAFRLGHPHNSLVLIAYEWGLLALLLVVGLLVTAAYKGMQRLFVVLNDCSGESYKVETVAIAMSVVALGGHSLVSGVTVMPYAQTWLAILGGALWAMLQQKREVEACTRAATFFSASLAWRTLAFVSCVWLLYSAVQEYPRVAAYELRTDVDADAPRFWLQGDIKLD